MRIESTVPPVSTLTRSLHEGRRCNDRYHLRPLRPSIPGKRPSGVQPRGSALSALRSSHWRLRGNDSADPCTAFLPGLERGFRDARRCTAITQSPPRQAGNRKPVRRCVPVRSRRRLFDAAWAIGASRQRIGRVWIQIRPQLVRRHAVTERLSDRNHHFGRGNFDFGLIEPAPYMHLPDLGFRYLRADKPCQVGLTAGKGDSFK